MSPLRARTGFVALALVAACSASTSEKETGAPAPGPTAKHEEATAAAGEGPGAGDAAPGPMDAAADAPRGSVGGCASCTAQRCMTKLQACGAAPGCVDALKAFNDCYGRSTTGSAACGAELAKSGPAAAALWACLEAKCAAECS
jgi:hypothetical protein